MTLIGRKKKVIYYLFKLSRTLKRIQYRSSNGYSLKRELQQGMNNFYNKLTAFNRIAANKGAGTPGVDNETIDGINLERLERYHQEYVNNGYNPKPVKRILIPNDNKGTRPPWDYPRSRTG
ncbi:hypothetical protein OC726_00380 [Candidatus Phytoplasma aurantifolia]|nr:hypothetical protein [Candidatus Phytoplasma aurantifolia]